MSHYIIDCEMDKLLNSKDVHMSNVYTVYFTYILSL